MSAHQTGTGPPLIYAPAAGCCVLVTCAPCRAVLAPSWLPNAVPAHRGWRWIAAG